MKQITVILFLILLNRFQIKELIKISNNDDKLINYNYSISKIISSFKINKKNIKIVISKTKYQLYFMNNNKILNTLLDKSKKNYKNYLNKGSIITLSLNLSYLPQDIEGFNESINYHNENLEYIEFLRRTGFKSLCNRFNSLTNTLLIENNLELKESFFVKKSSKNGFFSSNKHEQEILKYLDEHKILGVNKWEKPCNFLKQSLVNEKKEIIETLILLNKDLIKKQN